MLTRDTGGPGGIRGIRPAVASMQHASMQFRVGPPKRIASDRAAFLGDERWAVGKRIEKGGGDVAKLPETLQCDSGMAFPGSPVR